MTANDDLTQALHRELEEQAGGMAGSTLHLADVQGRARSIRRRRTATAVVGALAAVAVIVPTAALATHSNGRPEPAPATRSPSPTPTDDARRPGPGVLDVSHLPSGAAPTTDYLIGGTLHRPDGSTVELHTDEPIRAFVVLRDGTMVLQTTGSGRPSVQVVDPDGGLHGATPSAWGLAVNPAHTVAAWMGRDGQVSVLGAGQTRPSALGDPVTAGPDRSVAAVSGDDCALACTVYVNVADRQGARTPWEVTGSGSQPLRGGGFLSVADVSRTNLISGWTRVTDGGSCSKVAGGGELPGFSTCRHTLTAFSPSGTTVLAYPAYYDGLGPTSIGMYDVGTGHLLFERQADEQHQSFSGDASWEDDTHVLAAVFQDGEWSLVRIAVDGSMEDAVPPVAGRPEANPYVLPFGGAPVA